MLLQAFGVKRNQLPKPIQIRRPGEEPKTIEDPTPEDIASFFRNYVR